MKKRMLIMLLVLLVVLGGIFGFGAFRTMMIAKFMSGMSDPVQTVASATVAAQPWQDTVEAVGTLRAVNGVDLSLEVPGIVESLNFNSGDEVKAGAVLLQLRSADDTAKLQALQATADLAAITYTRNQKQIAAQAVSQAAVDEAAANLKNARAQAAQQQAMLDKKTIRAPFDGRLGLRSVDLGQYLNAGVTVVTLQSIDPIYVDFYLPQQALAQVQAGQLVTLTTDALTDQSFSGEITAIDSKIDTASRNVQVRATLKNPDRKLVPGMFGQISIAIGQPEPRLTVPQTAITYNPYGNTVYVVVPDTKATPVTDQKADKPVEPALRVEQRFVTTGSQRGDQVAVLKGLKEGDSIVSAGQNKLRPNMRVTIDNSIQPKQDANPLPKDE